VKQVTTHSKANPLEKEMMAKTMIYIHLAIVAVVSHHMIVDQEKRKVIIKVQQVLPLDKNNREINTCKNKEI